MDDQHVAQSQPPPPTQRHHASRTTTTDSELQQKVRFADSQFDNDHEPQPGGGAAAALHDSTKTGYELQQQHTGTHERPQTHAQHQPWAAAAPAPTAPDQTAQHQAGALTAASSAQQNAGRPAQQLTFFGSQMQAQILAQQQAEQAAQL